VARQALADREGIQKERANVENGVWVGENAWAEIERRIGVWARSKQIEAVVWTNLPTTFRGDVGRIPSGDEAVDYLRDLPHEKRGLAEHYIRMAPRQVDTEYRRRFEIELRWTPVGQDCS